jgi:alkylhydroperoxidase/carboxymuconolactone decarboxylase family protein YurZ
VEKALEEGATYEEVVEFLNVAMAMQGCPGEVWALKALEIFHRLEGARPRSTVAVGSDACCPK